MNSLLELSSNDDIVFATNIVKFNRMSNKLVLLLIKCDEVSLNCHSCKLK